MEGIQIIAYFETAKEGKIQEIKYDNEVKDGDTVRWSARAEIEGYTFDIEDSVTGRKDIIGYRIIRRIKGRPEKGFKNSGNGIMFALSFPIDSPPNCKWRFCKPTIDLSRPRRMVYKKREFYQGEKASGIIFGMYNCDKKNMYSIYRSSPWVENMERQKTLMPKKHSDNEMAALGYEIVEKDKLQLMISWPMNESYYPLDGSEIDINLDYLAEKSKSETFADGIFVAYKHLVSQVLDLKEESLREERIDLLQKAHERFKALYRNEEGRAEGFNGDADIMGFGMKERNVKIANFMAITAGDEWLKVQERMADFYANNCITSTGFAYTKFDRSKNEAISDFEGNYLLAMCQGVFDIFTAYKILKKKGIRKPALLEQTRKFADYLLRIQNSDGSWYHAYDNYGQECEAPVLEKMSLEIQQGTKKSGTEVPLCFMARLALYLESVGLHADEYRKSAVLCADYVLKNIIRFEMYLGGDPAFPAAPQKDAAKFALMGLYNTYDLTKDEKYLKGAVTAAKLFVVWNNRDYPCDCVELYKLGKVTGDRCFIDSTYFAYMDFDPELL